MHTFKGSQRTVFHYNSDMSGNVTVIDKNDTNKEFEIPALDILEFVAEFVRNQHIAKFEQMDVHELLNL